MSRPPVVRTVRRATWVESEASSADEIALASWSCAGVRTPARSSAGLWSRGMSCGARRSTAAAARKVIDLELYLGRLHRIRRRLEDGLGLPAPAERHPSP